MLTNLSISVPIALVLMALIAKIHQEVEEHNKRGIQERIDSGLEYDCVYNENLQKEIKWCFF
ncbi:MAG: hypothetical protein IIB02_04055 [Thaumarchaeota archaeon]|nr:hypothetical protein [Nitrososphaerota archaeon]